MPPSSLPATHANFGFAHGAFETEYQAIVEQRRMIDAVAVTDEGIGETAKIEQAYQSALLRARRRDFEAKHDADMTEGVSVIRRAKPLRSTTRFRKPRGLRQ